MAREATNGYNLIVNKSNATKYIFIFIVSLLFIYSLTFYIFLFNIYLLLFFITFNILHLILFLFIIKFFYLNFFLYFLVFNIHNSSRVLKFHCGHLIKSGAMTQWKIYWHVFLKIHVFFLKIFNFRKGEILVR